MELKEQLQAQLRRDGGRLAPVPDGPIIGRFDPLELAQAIEHEIARSHEVGHTKIKVDMTLDDAARLARFLRRGSLLGA